MARSSSGGVAIPGRTVYGCLVTPLRYESGVLRSVCLSVCLYVCVCLSASISLKPLDRSSRNLLSRSSVAVTRSSSGGVAICYILPVLWMTSRLAVVGLQTTISSLLRGIVALIPTKLHQILISRFSVIVRTDRHTHTHRQKQYSASPPR